MSKLDNLLVSVSKTISTYRNDELAIPTPEHVDRWLQQFNKENHVAFLSEFDYVLNECFITKNKISQFLDSLSKNTKLCGDNPAKFWASANFLNIQKNGQSQKEMLILFTDYLQNSYGFSLSQCGASHGDYIYLDDIIFSGGRAGSDLENWIVNFAPKSANVHVIVAALHTGGHYSLLRRLDEAIKKAGKTINITYWRSVEIENRKYYRGISNLLWPTNIPDVEEVASFMGLSTKFPFEPRQTVSKHVFPFSSELGRQILEREFLIAGAKIIAKIDSVKSNVRPLGFSPFGIGFGATIVTYRNCPNNCPLAIWWGDPSVKSGPLSWYPLLPREGYSSAKNVFKDLNGIDL